MNKPGIILLADKAGCLNDLSAEFMPLPEFNAALAPILESSLECFVVLSGSDALWEQRLDELGIHWSVCPDAHLGLDACAAFGVHCTQSWQSWIIDVASTPATPVELYRALSGAVRRYPIASAHSKDGKRSFPIAFDCSYGCPLMNHKNGILASALESHPSDAQMNWLNLSFASPAPSPIPKPNQLRDVRV